MHEERRAQMSRLLLIVEEIPYHGRLLSKMNLLVATGFEPPVLEITDRNNSFVSFKCFNVAFMTEFNCGDIASKQPNKEASRAKKDKEEMNTNKNCDTRKEINTTAHISGFKASSQVFYVLPRRT
jgi:hypothetical protein